MIINEYDPFFKCLGKRCFVFVIEPGETFNLTLSVPVVLLNSPNLSPYFSLNKFERILCLIFSGLLCLINSHFLITKSLILSVLCEEKVGVDK